MLNKSMERGVNGVHNYHRALRHTRKGIRPPRPQAAWDHWLLGRGAHKVRGGHSPGEIRYGTDTHVPLATLLVQWLWSERASSGIICLLGHVQVCLFVYLELNCAVGKRVKWRGRSDWCYPQCSEQITTSAWLHYLRVAQAVLTQTRSDW